MKRWQHFIWVGALAVLLGGWTTPALAQNRQAGAKSFNQQGGGTCQQGNTSGQGSGVNAAASARASSGRNSSGTQAAYRQMVQQQIAMTQQYMAQLSATQQLNQTQMAMLNQYLSQLMALQQQLSQNGNSQTSSGQSTAASTSVNANAALARRTAAR
jgi:hypothetical protein